MSTGKAESGRAEARAAEDRGLAKTAAADAKKPTFFEEEAEQEYIGHRRWKEAKDYRKPPPGLITLGYGDPAQRKEMRDRTFNAADTGSSALAGEGNATALKAYKLNLADEWDRDQSSAYESAIQQEDNYQRTGSATWGGMAANRSLNIAQLYNSNAQNSSQLAAQLRPQSLLPSLIGGALGVGAAFAGKPPTPRPR